MDINKRTQMVRRATEEETPFSMASDIVDMNSGDRSAPRMSGNVV